MKLHFAISRNSKAQFLKKKINKLYKNYSPKKSDAIVVCGGDGFMLLTLQKFYKLKKPFYGINCGNLGYLLNSFKIFNILDAIKQSNKIILNPLEVLTFSKKGKIKKFIAVNEVSLLRQSKQTCSVNIKVNNKILLRKLVGDGIILSTPIGSTGYNSSAGGPKLNLNSSKLVLAPVSPFYPKNWKGKIINNNSKVEITNTKISRPISLVADNTESRNLKKTFIFLNKKIKIELLFDPTNNFKKKINNYNKKKL